MSKGAGHGMAKLTEVSVTEIRRLAMTDRRNSNRVLAARFGVSPAAIGLIVSGVTWSHVPMPDVRPEDVVVAPSVRRSGYRQVPIDVLRVAEESFWENVERGSPDECWPWTGRANPEGRGFFNAPGHSNLIAPRVALALSRGEDIVAMDCIHSCDNPRCVNPSHLSPGTDKDNMDDMRAKGRARGRGRSKRSTPLTEEDVRTIRREYGTRAATQRELAERFQMSARQIWHICARHSWAHVD